MLSGGLSMERDGVVIAAFNMAPYNGHPGALYLNSARGDDAFGDVADGEPGGLLHRCAR